MTSGHKHRVVRAPAWVIRLLRVPLYKTRDLKKVDASPYPYGPVEPPVYAGDSQWYLSTLSILHRWTGLTIQTGDPSDDDSG